MDPAGVFMPLKTSSLKVIKANLCISNVCISCLPVWRQEKGVTKREDIGRRPGSKTDEY